MEPVSLPKFSTLGEFNPSIKEGVVKNSFVKVDAVCDYIPGISTLTNLMDLFQKCALSLPFAKEITGDSHYYKHLEEKSFLRCLVLLIPVIGNIFVIADDIKAQYIKKQSDAIDLAIGLVKQDPSAFESLSEELRSNFHVAFYAVEKNPLALEHFIYKGKDGEITYSSIISYRDIVAKAVAKDGLALQYADPSLQNDQTIVITATRQNSSAFQFASEELRRNDNLQASLIFENSMKLQDANSSVRARASAVTSAVQHDWHAIRYAAKKCRDNSIVQFYVKQECRKAIISKYGKETISDEERYLCSLCPWLRSFIEESFPRYLGDLEDYDNTI